MTAAALGVIDVGQLGVGAVKVLVDQDVIERRVANAKGEIEHCDDFDYVLVNEDFDRSYAELAHIYHAERSRRHRNLWVEAYKSALMKEVV